MSDSVAGTAELAPATELRADALIIGYVGFAHLISHFFQLVLPPLFPWLRLEFGYSYAQLGVMMSVLFVLSGVGQVVAGFLVDHYGAFKTLCAGLVCLALGALVAAVAGSYAGFVAGAALIGLGNAVFHPADFWILNHRVSVPRLGAAFSVHGLTGSIGWALAPVFMVFIATQWGWREALVAASSLPIVTVVVLLGLARLLRVADAELAQSGAAEQVPTSLAFLRLPAVWLCFAFFAAVAAALGGIQSFSPTIFSGLYGIATVTAAMSVTVYMIASACGMVAGAWLVSRSQTLERNITIALLLSVFAGLAIGANVVPVVIAFVLMAVMGFGSGLSGPSRDMMIRNAAPRGATGRVYGVVYSGLDIGIAAGPAIFGLMLDRGMLGSVYVAMSGCLFLAVLLAWRVAATTR